MNLLNFVITGGNKGIGRAIAVQAAQKKYRVFITYEKDKKSANDVIDELKLIHSCDHKAFQLSVQDENSVEGFFTMLDNEGGLSCLINNAGIVDLMSNVANYPKGRIENIFAINVFGTIYCSKQAILRMAFEHGGKGGVIINMSSIASRLGSAFEYVDYAASKAAVDTFSLGLGKEMANQGVRVISVRPGIINTSIHKKSGDGDRPEKIKNSIPMKRVGEAEEVANTVMWLVSDAASYLTACTLDVSGGR